MAHAITIAAASAGLNQFVNKNSAKIHSLMRQELEFERELPFVQADYAYTGVETTVGSVLQPYQSQFTPNNAETFDGITSILRPIKVDLQFDDEQLQKFYSKWAANWFDPDPEGKRMTYAQYMIQNHIMPLIIEDLNKASWAGAYSAPTPGTAGAVLDSVDGFKTQIATHITDSRLTPINTGVISTMDVATVRAFVAGIPEPYRYRKGKIFMSKTHAQSYSDDYKSTYAGNSAVISGESVQGLRLRVDDFNKEIVGVTAMEGSDRIVCVFDAQESMIVGTRTGYPQYFNFRFEPVDRNLKCFAEIYRFYNFETTKHCFVNEQV